MTGQTLLCVSLELNQTDPSGSLCSKMILASISTFVPWFLMLCYVSMWFTTFLSPYLQGFKKNPFGLLRRNIREKIEMLNHPTHIYFLTFLLALGCFCLSLCRRDPSELLRFIFLGFPSAFPESPWEPLWGRAGGNKPHSHVPAKSSKSEILGRCCSFVSLKWEILQAAVGELWTKHGKGLQKWGGKSKNLNLHPAGSSADNLNMEYWSREMGWWGFHNKWLCLHPRVWKINGGKKPQMGKFQPQAKGAEANESFWIRPADYW